MIAAVGSRVAARERAAGVVEALAVYARLLVGTLLIPLVLPVVARVAGAPLRSCSASRQRLARNSVVRDRSRTTLTLGDLTIGLAMIVALGGVGQNALTRASGCRSPRSSPETVAPTSIRPIAADVGAEADLAASCRASPR